MKCYVAGSTKDQERVQLVQGLVQGLGHELTFDWCGPDQKIKPSWKFAAEEAAAHSSLELDAAKSADFLVLVTPPSGQGLGCYIELGAAMASGKRCIVFELVGRDSVFFYHPLVQVVRDNNELLDALMRL